MKTVLVLTTLALSVSGLAITSSMRSSFKTFEHNFNKTYNSKAEREARIAIYAQNLKKIEDHNRQKGNKWSMKVTQFADMTESEFKSTLTYKKPSNGHATSPSFKVTKSIKDLPAEVDWRDKGVISEVKDQGSCGSCWAFATVEQLESYLKIAKGDDSDLVKLSVQQIVSCCPNPNHCGGTGGCSGSISQIGYLYANLFGIVKEEDYVYTSGMFGNTGSCKYDADSMDGALYIRGYETIPRNDVATTMQHLAEVGPLAVAADASSWSFYSDGIYNGCSYDKNIDINHAIQLVGYGSDNGEDFWLVRNSWGTYWGEQGYIRLKREAETVCGEDNTPAFGLACEGDGNDVQKVCGMCGVLFDSTYPIGAGDVNTVVP